MTILTSHLLLPAEVFNGNLVNIKEQMGRGSQMSARISHKTGTSLMHFLKILLVISYPMVMYITNPVSDGSLGAMKKARLMEGTTAQLANVPEAGHLINQCKFFLSVPPSMRQGSLWSRLLTERERVCTLLIGSNYCCSIFCFLILVY